MLWRGLRLFDDAKGVYCLSCFVLNFKGIVMKHWGVYVCILSLLRAMLFFLFLHAKWLGVE